MPEVITECRYCEQAHEPTLLCEPARKVLDALLERGQRFDMPTVEFPEAINHADAFGEDSVLVAGVVVKAAVTEVAGTPQPVLIFTGTDIDGKALPNWLYVASAPDMKRVMKLVTEMGTMAIRRARGAT
ncbi:MAG: hypothetical protein WAL04_18880 [Acidimicrobiales bacterium]